MNITNLKRAHNIDVKQWFFEEIPNITPYQKEKIKDMIHSSPFYFMEDRKKVDNIWLRLTILFILPVLFLLIICLPINFLLTGSWGYNYEKISWFNKWVHSCGL